VKKRLTKNDWIEAAMNVLVSGGGISHVRVDKLAHELKITRGSFYYHFNNREELLTAMVDKWRTNATESVISSLRFKHSDPKEQLISLSALPLKGKRAFDAASTELALRAWARRDKLAKSTLAEVDKYRVSFIESLFTEINNDKQKSEDLSFLFYSYLLGLSFLPTDKSSAESQDQSERIIELLSSLNNKASQ
jgi:AcrR family transcriptional regulator